MESTLLSLDSIIEKNRQKSSQIQSMFSFISYLSKTGKLDSDKISDIESFLSSIYSMIKTSENNITKLNVQGKTYIYNHAKSHMLTKFLTLKLNKVTLKLSKIHGRGVFTTQKIQKGELITFYPADVVEYTPNRDRSVDGHMGIGSGSERLINRFGNEASNDPSYRDNDYAFVIDSQYAIIGHPEFDSDSTYLGHFINDGAKCGSTLQSQIIYSKITILKQNCDFKIIGEGLHVAIVAIRDIEIDEELFIPYGIQYWQSFHKKYEE